MTKLKYSIKPHTSVVNAKEIFFGVFLIGAIIPVNTTDQERQRFRVEMVGVKNMENRYAARMFTGNGADGMDYQTALEARVFKSEEKAVKAAIKFHRLLIQMFYENLGDTVSTAYRLGLFDGKQKKLGKRIRKCVVLRERLVEKSKSKSAA